jgi:hypothetical protein
MRAFRSSYEVLLFSSDCNQWSVVVTDSNTIFSENPSNGGRVFQCSSTDRRTEKINLSYFRSFCEGVYKVRMTAAGITSLLYVITFSVTVSVRYCAELRFLLLLYCVL